MRPSQVWGMHFRRIIVLVLAHVSLGAMPAHAETGSPQDIWLKVHNDARAEFGSAPLVWNSELEEQAKAYAKELARTARMKHSPRSERPGQGENLWMGTKRRFSHAEMIQSLVDEKQFFKPGPFPEVSSTGKWGDVGHYTQIVWRTTREVGCAKAEGRQFGFLVCRYYPAGNVIGTYLAPN